MKDFIHSLKSVIQAIQVLLELPPSEEAIFMQQLCVHGLWTQLLQDTTSLWSLTV